MKKRLRKKKRFGEFQELGFHLGFRCPDTLNRNDYDILIDMFIEQAIEKNDLQFGGGGQFEWNGYALAKNNTTNEHREAVKQWFFQEPLILEFYIDPLSDAWHGENSIEQLWIKKSHI